MLRRGKTVQMFLHSRLHNLMRRLKPIAVDELYYFVRENHMNYTVVDVTATVCVHITLINIMFFFFFLHIRRM